MFQVSRSGLVEIKTGVVRASTWMSLGIDYKEESGLDRRQRGAERFGRMSFQPA